MPDFESSSWYKHPGRLAGIVIMGYFLIRFLAIVHLGVLGRVTEGTTGRLEGRTPDPGEPVIYFYRVGDSNYHGWRRGLHYGGERLAVVHSPWHARIHVVAADPNLATCRTLWRTPDFILRLLLPAFGFALGWVTYVLWTRHQQGRFSINLLPGLSRRRDP